jgi:hypothetical protein
MNAPKRVPFVSACQSFFGRHPGQSLADFGAELKALSFDERKALAADMRSAGIECDDPQVPAAPAATTA